MTTTNILCDLILKYPNEDWCWEYLTINKLIPLEFIDKNIHLPWTFKNGIHYLSKNRLHSCIQKCVSDRGDLTLEFIIKYINRPWDWISLVSNPIITQQFILDCLNNKYNLIGGYGNRITTDRFADLICTLSLPRNTNITESFIQTLHKKYNLTIKPKRIIKYQKDTTVEDTMKKYEKYDEQFIKENILSLDRDILSSCSNITFDLVFNTWYLDWNWSKLSANLSIGLDCVLDYPMIKWDDKQIFSRKDITVDFFENYGCKKYPNNCRKYRNEFIKNSPYFTIEFAKQFCKKNKKNWQIISSLVKPSVIKDNKLPWDWTALWANNPHINTEFIKQYEHKINFNLLSFNNNPNILF